MKVNNKLRKNRLKNNIKFFNNYKIKIVDFEHHNLITNGYKEFNYYLNKVYTDINHYMICAAMTKYVYETGYLTSLQFSIVRDSKPSGMFDFVSNVNIIKFYCLYLSDKELADLLYNLFGSITQGRFKRFIYRIEYIGLIELDKIMAKLFLHLVIPIITEIGIYGKLPYTTKVIDAIYKKINKDILVLFI